MEKNRRWPGAARCLGNDGMHARHHSVPYRRNRKSGFAGVAFTALATSGSVFATGGTFRNLVLALMVVTASGCGYQLRGAVSLPSDLDGIHVAGPRDIGAALTLVLDGGGVQVQSDRDSAKAVLRLSGELFDRRVLSVDSNTGKEREFELAYQVAFELTGADGEELLPRQMVSLVRDYVFDANEVLGKSREQAVLHAEMRRDAATQIVRRIAASLGQ